MGRQTFSCFLGSRPSACTTDWLLGKTSALNTDVPPFFSFRRACVAEHNAGGVGYPFGQLGSALLVTSLQTYSLQGGGGEQRGKERTPRCCASTACQNVGELSTLSRPQIQTAAPYGLLWRKLTPSPPDPEQIQSLLLLFHTCSPSSVVARNDVDVSLKIWRYRRWYNVPLKRVTSPH